MKIADMKTKALSKLHLLVFEPFQTNFYWLFGGNSKFREMQPLAGIQKFYWELEFLTSESIW
jgi:hypothetical protein